MRKLLVLALLAGSFSFGCSKGGDAKKLAELCVQTTETLKTQSGDPNADIMQMIQNSLMACSGACDGDDKTSCATLTTHVDKLCGVNADTCKALCSSVKSPSLKKATCDFKPAAP